MAEVLQQCNARPKNILWLGAILLCAACDSGNAKPVSASAPAAQQSSESAAKPKKTAPEVKKAKYPGAPRIIAIGDVHGDFNAAKEALRLAGAIGEKDGKDTWIGGSLVVVQVGDQLDRGDNERAILEFFDRMPEEAKQAGGAFYILNGNHEVMNIAGDFRYVTEGGFKDFENISGLPLSDPRVEKIPPNARARAAAFLPGAPFAKMLAKRDIIAIVGDTVFVHGGLSPEHIYYGIDKINDEVKAWMNGETSQKTPPAIVNGDDAPVWTRVHGGPSVTPRDCEVLASTLEAIQVKRMVIGHTVQKGGISSVCDGKAWRVDVGLSAYYGGKPEVLEIEGDKVRVLRKESAPASASASAPAKVDAKTP